MSEIRERLGTLCDQITRHADMDQEIRGAGAGPQLDELLAVVRGQGSPDPKRVVALLDEIEDACARQGLVGVTTVNKNYTPLPQGLNGGWNLPVGVDGSRDAEPPTWVCPTGQCARTVFDDETTSESPICLAGGGMPMTPIRVLG